VALSPPGRSGLRRVAVAGTLVRNLVGLVSAATVLLSATVAHAGAAGAGCASCLGPATKDGTTWWAPTDDFKRGGMPFTKGKLPEIVMLGAQGDKNTAAMAWPMVKALEQFGAWSDLVPAARFCANSTCELPTFDLERAKLRSRYVAFAYDSIATRANKSRMETLSPKEKLFFDKYVRARGYSSDTGYFVWATEGGGAADGVDRLPGISIGPYISLGTKLLIEGDFATAQPLPGGPSGSQTLTGLPFDTVQQALEIADRTRYSSLVHDVNAEANLLTAVICKVDGNQPHKACNRGVVKGIARHLT